MSGVHSSKYNFQHSDSPVQETMVLIGCKLRLFSLFILSLTNKRSICFLENISTPVPSLKTVESKMAVTFKKKLNMKFHVQMTFFHECPIDIHPSLANEQSSWPVGCWELPNCLLDATHSSSSAWDVFRVFVSQLKLFTFSFGSSRSCFCILFSFGVLSLSFDIFFPLFQGFLISFKIFILALFFFSTGDRNL